MENLVSYFRFLLENYFYNKNVIRVFNFWSNLKPEDLWFNPIFDEHLNHLFEKKVKVNFYSCFGPRKYMHWDKKSNIKIFFTGENVFQFPWLKYGDHCLNFVDLSMGFERDVQAENYIHLPLWILYYFNPTDSLVEIKQKLRLIEEKKYKEDLRSKQFCCLVASHDSNGNRKRGMDVLSRIDVVKSGGRFMNNTDELKNRFNNNKHDFLKNFKFNMAFENSNRKYYTTEKIFDAIFAGCIPIYYGSDNEAEPDVLNQKRIIYFEKQENMALLDRLNSNDESLRDYYKQPIFNDSAADWIYERIKETRERITDIIQKKCPA